MYMHVFFNWILEYISLYSKTNVLKSCNTSVFYLPGALLAEKLQTLIDAVRDLTSL